MINLHTHTNKSLDGVLDVNEILNICEENNISYVSITDHDTCDAYKDIKDNNYTGTLVTGIEADALIGKETYDILCYGFDVNK
ncbi:MAG: PHP domain-containing protein [Bacilli bacterium]|nr:PHP domain-containing protein [Bacilli bacterium]